MTKRVVVLGAGVAGLTVAHELVNRGFDVTVYERRDEPGGKSRSYMTGLCDVHGRPVPGDRVPGEHGFRFFPGFYRHLDATMAEIPATQKYRKSKKHPATERKTVLDCLTPINDELLAASGRAPIAVPARAPITVKDIRTALRLPRALGDCGLTDDDLATFADKLWQIATSCQERRDAEYEQIGWRDFVESKDRSSEYYWYLASGLTRALVAARARYASAKTMGNIALRLFAVVLDPGQSTDRVLCGPTNDVWMNPWVDYIEERVESRKGNPKGRGKVERSSAIKSIGIEDGRVTHVTIARRGDEGTVEDVKADYFVSALPMEDLSDLIEATPDLRAHRQFRDIVTMRKAEGSEQCLRKMSGLQIYCRRPLQLGGRPLNEGHQLLLDSPWGLTSIDQGQFWEEMPENVGAILSVDISSWDIAGLKTREKASDLTSNPVKIFREVCAQIRAGLGDELLTDDNIIGWNLDTSPELLLVNRVDSWHLRPTAGTPLPNLKLAGDFVQTKTDLACMEGANEAARLAVNEILADEGWPAHQRCPLWAPTDPLPLRPFQEIDRGRYARGLPWSGSSSVGKWLVSGAHMVADPLGTDPPPKPVPDTNRPARSEWDDAAPPAMRVKALTNDEIQVELDKYSQYEQPGRSDPMFKRWRLYRNADDPKYLVPLHVYKADSLIVYGTASNLECLKELTKGTGYHPVSGVKDGQRVGFAELWIVHYIDTSMGRCCEVAINFVVSTDRHKPSYEWKSPYSALVPMMDPANRLFTPELVLQEQSPPPGCIEYGNDLFGMNKLRGKVQIGYSEEDEELFTFSCSQLETRGPDQVVRACREEFALSGQLHVGTSKVNAATSAFEIARVMGLLPAARNAAQSLAEDEISGGLATRDFRPNAKSPPGRVPSVEIKAAYKFAPTICELDPKNRILRVGSSSFGALLTEMGFNEAIVGHTPNLKSVLYTAGCPTPDD